MLNTIRPNDKMSPYDIIRHCDDMIRSVQSEMEPVKKAISGNGSIINYGKRLGVDVSINISDLLKRIKDSESLIGTYEENNLLFGGGNGQAAQDAELSWDNINKILNTTHIVLDSGATINEFSTDVLLAGNSDTAVPTEKAVKTYADVIEASAVLIDGTRELTANWDAGSFKITAEQFESDIAIGTAPFPCTSTTLNTNLNADLWDGYEFADYLDQAVKTTSSPTLTHLTVSREDSVIRLTDLQDKAWTQSDRFGGVELYSSDAQRNKVVAAIEVKHYTELGGGGWQTPHPAFEWSLVDYTTGDLTLMMRFMNSADLEIFGNIGIGGFPIAPLYVKDTAFPLATCERIATSDANAVWLANMLKCTTTYDMGDGFGVGFIFAIEDSAEVENLIGLFGGARDGADNSGKIVFQTALNGAIGDGEDLALELLANNDMHLPNDSAKILFGAGKDFGITFNGTDAIIDYDLLNAGTTDFRIQEDGSDRFVIYTGGDALITGKLAFTQTDLNEYIDSLTDGYMDYGATTAHRFNNDIDIASGKVLKVNSTKVVSAQQSHIVDADGTLADITTKFNTLLLQLESHGLNASA